MWFNSGQEEEQQVTDEAISQRAYEIWQERGCPATDGAEDWQAAKEQLLAETCAGFGAPKPLRRFLGRLRSRAAM